MLVEALQNILANDAAVAALLGSTSARPDSTNGVFPSQAPDQPSMPYIVFSQVSGAPLSVLMKGTTQFTEERWRFSCYGTTYKNAKALAKKVRLALIDIVPGHKDAGDVLLSGAYCVMEADATESIGRGTLFSTVLDFSVVYADDAN